MSDQPINGSEDKLALSGNTNVLQSMSEPNRDNDAINIDQLKNLPPLPVADPDPAPESANTPTADDPEKEKLMELVATQQEGRVMEQVDEPAADLKRNINFSRKTSALENSQLQLNQDILSSLENESAIGDARQTNVESPINFDGENENIELNVNETDEDYSLMDPNHVSYF
jgi:hypothetical protein